MADQTNHSSVTALIVAWLVVGIPAAWGVTQTVDKSLDLFRGIPHTVSSLTTMPSDTTMPPVLPATMPVEP